MMSPIAKHAVQPVAHDGRRALARKITQYHEWADNAREEMKSLSPDSARFTELKASFDWLWEQRNVLAEEFRNWGNMGPRR